VKQLAKEIGLRGPILSRRMRKAGVQMRGRAEARRLKAALPDEVCQLLRNEYQAGKSVPDLAAATGLTMWQIYGFFKTAGIKRRSASQAKQLLWEGLSEGERRMRMTASLEEAWAARRGQRIPLETKIRAARTRFERLQHVGEGEESLANALKDAGLKVAQQFPIGPYNVDIAIRSARIAVEIERPKSPTHGSSLIAAERTKYLLDEGWTVLYAFLNSIRAGATLDVPHAAKDIISIAESLSRNETARGQYGVIGSDREASPGFRSQLKNLPRIPGF
jgi:very-short-patch-repair endonuclease